MSVHQRILPGLAHQDDTGQVGNDCARCGQEVCRPHSGEDGRRIGQEQRARLRQVGNEAVYHGRGGPDVLLPLLKEFRRCDADRNDDVDRPLRIFGLEVTDQAQFIVRSREAGEIEAFAVDHRVALPVLLRGGADSGKDLRIKGRAKIGFFQNQDRTLLGAVGCDAFTREASEQAGDQDAREPADHTHCRTLGLASGCNRVSSMRMHARA